MPGKVFYELHTDVLCDECCREYLKYFEGFLWLRKVGTSPHEPHEEELACGRCGLHDEAIVR